MSDTPLTDAFLLEGPTENGWLDFARQLEREQAVMNAEIKRLREYEWMYKELQK